MNKSYECTLCYSDGSSTTHQVEIEDDFNDGLVAEYGVTTPFRNAETERKSCNLNFIVTTNQANIDK
jgi:hypothetical protein